MSRNCRCPGNGQGVRHVPTAGHRHERRSGVTLLELLVVISLLGLVLAIAAPALIFPKEKQETEIAKVVGTARRAAILRGEPVTIAFNGSAWRIESDAAPTAPPIGAGSFSRLVATFRLHVSPLGTCVVDADGKPTAGSWNALDCREVTVGVPSR